MAKKKEKPQMINNIQNLNLEIDYDKLAEAIIKAQEKGADNQQKSKHYTLGTFAAPLIAVFYGLSILGWLVVTAIPIGVYQIWYSFNWNDVPNCIASSVTLLITFGIMFVIALYSILLWKAAKEVEAETDRNYVISMFSGVVSFAALIVALVALIKG